jgi:hypothetical protein
MTREEVLRRQPDEVLAPADHDFGLEGKPACDFIAQLRTAYRPADHEGTRRANVDGIEMPQLLRELSWSESPVTADVETP